MPDLKWLPHSENEIALTGAELINYSDTCYQIGEIIAVGFIYHNYLSPPWMWFALAEGITLGHLIDFRRLSEEIPQGTLTGVRSDYELGFRFAKLYGFEDTGDVRKHVGISYNIFRRK
jgi:hypothetical protein